MKKLLLSLLFTSLIITPVKASDIEQVNIEVKMTDTKGKKGNYDYQLSVEDWGPVVDKLILDKKDVSLNKDSFSISIERDGVNIEDSIDSLIKHVYLSDKSGVQKENGNFITIELDKHPEIPHNNPLVFDMDTMLNTWSDLHFIVSHESGEVWDNDIGDISSYFDNFSFKRGIFNDEELNYALYSPKTEEKKPLLIWLHGMGEGGDDLRLPLLGNKAINLTSEKIQEQLGEAYVLYPQAPTFWMDSGDGEFTENGETKYAQSLQTLIEKVINENGIDDNRVYLSGASNGGFMAMRLLLDNPNFYASVIPIAQPYNEEWLTDQDYETLLKTPLWFVQTETDPVVPADVNSTAIVDKLREKDHPYLEYSLYDKIEDQTGNFKDKEGSPYEYHPHFSWVPYLNDDLISQDEKQGVFTWMANFSLESNKGFEGKVLIAVLGLVVIAIVLKNIKNQDN